MHIYEGMGIGRVLPHGQEFIIEDILNYKDHGIRMSRFIMWQEPGTRLNLGMITSHQDQIKLDELLLSDLYERETVILDIPKGPEEGVLDKDVEKAFSELDYREGDWVIVHTGWGDNQRYFDLGDDYVIKSPYFTKEAAKKLVEIMRENKSSLLGYDTASASRPAKHIIPEWYNRKPRPRGWPSTEAKEYLKNYKREKIMDDWGSSISLLQAGINTLGGLVNIGTLTKKRVKLTIFPLKIKGIRGGPCRAAAIEEQY